MNTVKNIKKKVLLIRFSSFGDVTQSLSIPSKLAAWGAEVYWVTRLDLAPLLENHPSISKIWSLDKRKGFLGLINLIFELRSQKFTHIYDAHNNLRSHIISWCLKDLFLNPTLLRKSQKR